MMKAKMSSVHNVVAYRILPISANSALLVMGWIFELHRCLLCRITDTVLRSSVMSAAEQRGGLKSEPKLRERRSRHYRLGISSAEVGLLAALGLCSIACIWLLGR